MSTKSPAPAGGKTDDGRVYVQIPKAGPGQGYHAPKNYRHPFLSLLTRLVIVLLCLSLPIVPGLIIALIVFLPGSQAVNYLWLWIPMFLFVEAIAIFVAIGVGREALGSAGAGDYTRP
jgi:hypothetical protein